MRLSQKKNFIHDFELETGNGGEEWPKSQGARDEVADAEKQATRLSNGT